MWKFESKLPHINRKEEAETEREMQETRIHKGDKAEDTKQTNKKTRIRTGKQRLVGEREREKEQTLIPGVNKGQET